MPCSRSPGGVSAPGEVCSQEGGVAFCYGLLVWWPSHRRQPSGMVFGGPEGHNRRHHTRRPPHQKATTPEGHHIRRHHTRRPPHQKAITEEGVPGGDPPKTATAVGSMHPTGMHSSSLCSLYFRKVGSWGILF